MNDYVDRNELRTNLDVILTWGHYAREPIAHNVMMDVSTILNMAPTLPRGWSRDELLAAMDAVPGTVVERLTMDGLWSTLRRVWVERWPDDVVSYDVRVVAPPEPKTEDVPWCEVEGKMPVAVDETHGTWERPVLGVKKIGGEVFFYDARAARWSAWPLNADGTVTVQAEGEA